MVKESVYSREDLCVLLKTIATTSPLDDEETKEILRSQCFLVKHIKLTLVYSQLCSVSIHEFNFIK